MKKVFILFVFIFTTLVGFAQPPVYKDVAAIFYARCTHCHNQNHKFPFLNYTQTQPLKVLIQNDLNINRMPPWHPDTTYANAAYPTVKRFSNEHLISSAEKTAILNWITAGAQKGDTTLAPPAPVYPKFKLSGNADITLKIPTFSSNAFTSDAYNCFSIPTGLTQDRILRAYEIVPGNPAIVHHVVINVDTTGSIVSDLSGGCYTQGGQFSIGGFAPGSPPIVFPNGATLKAGIRLKAGSQLILQLHYPIGTAGQTDSTKIRLYFYPIGTTGVRPIYVETPLQYWNFSPTAIPANQTRTYTAVSSATFASATYSISIYATFPHAHKVNKSIVNFAYKTTDTIPLIRINNWDFDFQGFYMFKKMVKVPKTYKLYSKHVYDNTMPHVATPTNVAFGTSTKDEMLFDAFMYLIYQPGDELINVDSILSADPILAIGIKENPAIVSNNFTSYAFPNPFENSVRIGYVLDNPTKVTVDIYSIYGSLVKSLCSSFENAGVHEIVWDSKNNDGINLSGGTYFYLIRAGAKQSYGKLSLMPSKN